MQAVARAQIQLQIVQQEEKVAAIERDLDRIEAPIKIVNKFGGNKDERLERIRRQVLSAHPEDHYTPAYRAKLIAEAEKKKWTKAEILASYPVDKFTQKYREQVIAEQVAKKNTQEYARAADRDYAFIEKEYKKRGLSCWAELRTALEEEHERAESALRIEKAALNVLKAQLNALR